MRAGKSEAGAKALVVAATPGYHKPQLAPSKSKWGKHRSKFDGGCSKCGRRGHSGDECRGDKQKKKYDGCFICSSQEHKAANCPKRWNGENGNESALLTRATTVAIDSRNTSLGSCETWTPDSRATSTLTSSSEGFLYYTVELGGRYICRDSKREAAACGGVRTAGDRGQTTGGNISVGKVLHVPKLKCNLIFKRQMSLMSGLLFVKSPAVAHPGTGMLF